MTSVTSLVNVPSFRRAVEALGRSVTTEPDGFRQAIKAGLLETTAHNSGRTDHDMTEALRAYQVLFGIARRESVDELVEDLAKTELLDASQLERISPLLRGETEYGEQVDATSARDGLLPNLFGSHVSLDLRVVKTESSTLLMPVVIARLEFDENVVGSNAASFQIPRSALVELRDLLTDALSSADEIVTTVQQASVPPWAWGATDE